MMQVCLRYDCVTGRGWPERVKMPQRSHSGCLVTSRQKNISLGVLPIAYAEMTPRQSRAARGWLGWSQRDLAARTNVALNTVNEFEAGRRTPTANNLAAPRRAIEAEGIRLLFDEAGAAVGIARHDARIAVLERLATSANRADADGGRARSQRSGTAHPFILDRRTPHLGGYGVESPEITNRITRKSSSGLCRRRGISACRVMTLIFRSIRCDPSSTKWSPAGSEALSSGFMSARTTWNASASRISRPAAPGIGSSRCPTISDFYRKFDGSPV